MGSMRASRMSTSGGIGVPRLVRDLPAGGRRFLQVGQGYIGTWVAAERVVHDGAVTPARPGRLLRMGRAGR